MSNVTQIYSIVNAAVADFMGSYNVRAKDTTSFVDLGRSLGDLTTEADPYHGYDAFFGALVSRIAKTEVFVRLYENSERRVLTDYIDFGAFVQKIYAEMPDAVSNPVWSVSNGQNPPTISSASPYDVTTTVGISSLIYGKRGTWSIELKYPTVQIKTAFLSESAMMAFIDGIYTQISNSLATELEALENLAVNTSMAACIHNGNATNVLQEYNLQVGSESGMTLHVSDCLENLSFLAFANKLIDNTRGYMKKMSKKFNIASYPTFTPTDKCRVEVLTDFASASKFYLESNTFHDELVRMEGYTEVPWWQSPGTDGIIDFAEASKISIDNADVYADAGTGAPITVSQSGIIAFLRDDENVKAYFGDRNTWEVVNPRERTVIHGEHADLGYAVDPHANAWVFYIADET